MSRANHHRLLRTLPLACLAAALAAAAGCKGPDPGSFACTSSRECPGDYHCDLGTATAAGSLKCVSGAPVPRTLAADATKFLLVKRPNADGTVRTTISAAPGAITSTPDFVGVRAIASQASADLGSSPVQSDGSVPVFQLPQALTQVSIRIQDDSGRFITVSGYPERVLMSFEGKNVAGNANPIAAYDAATGTDSLFEPAAWSAGLAEIPASSTITNGIASPAAYNGLSSFDGISSQTAIPPQPTTSGPIGWERITAAPTAANPGIAPPPRTDMAVAQIGISVGSTFYPFILYGGLDATAGLADPGSAPTIWAFTSGTTLPNTTVGWTTVPTVTSTTPPGPFPSSSAAFGLATTPQLATISRAGTALAPGGSFNCTSGACTGINYNMNFVVAGGTKTDGTMTNNVFGYGSRTISGNVFLGWWDESAEGQNAGTPTPRLLAPNAGMASAVFSGNSIPVPSGTNQVFYSGIVMVGGRGIIPAGQPGANNDTAACQYLTTFSGGANPNFQVTSCTTAEWATLAAAGQIGFRTGAALTATDNTGSDGAAVYLFGGNRSSGPVGANGLQNDVWKGTISVVCSAPPPALPCTAPAVAQTQITWAPVTTTGTKPSPRSGAAIAFGESRKLVVYGGTDATGVQSDVWELDLSAATPSWRRFSLEPTPALAPAARSKSVMLGPTTYATTSATMLFGGTAGTTLTNDVWALSRQGPSRLLIKAPAGISSRSQATNASMSITAAGTLVIPPVFIPPFFIIPTQTPNLLYGWDGSAWQFLGGPGTVGGNIFVSPQNAMNYVQSDGNVYLLLMSRFRSTVGAAATTSVQLDGLEVRVDFQ